MHKHPEHFDMQVYFESWLFWPRVPRVVPGVVPDCLDPDGSESFDHRAPRSYQEQPGAENLRRFFAKSLTTKLERLISDVKHCNQNQI